MKTMLLVAGLAVMAVTGCWANKDASDSEREILIRFKAGVTAEQIEGFMNKHQLEVKERFSLIENLFLCRIKSNREINEVLLTLGREPEVQYVEENQRVHALKERTSE